MKAAPLQFMNPFAQLEDEILKPKSKSRIEDIGRVKTLTLRKLDGSSSDSNSVT